MATNYAQIESGIVIGLVFAGSDGLASTDFIDLTPFGAVELGQTWDGTTFGPAPTPTPTPRLRLSVREFREQFTAAEKAGIYSAAKDPANVAIEVWLDDLRSVEYVDLDFQQTIDSVNGLEAAGLIGPGRAAEILTGI